MARYALRETTGDVEPFEVVDVLTDQMMVLRGMACDLAPGWKPHIVMGFCENEADQKWIIKPDLTAVPFRVKWSKYYGWRDQHGSVYKVVDEPRRWHRYGRMGWR